MAISTFKTFLMHKDTSAFEKLVDIKSFPDLGSDPELLDTTTLSDRMKTSIIGIQGAEALVFEANYDKADFTKLKALEGKTEEYAVWLGGTDQSDGTVIPDGSEGKYKFKGQLSVRITGGNVNAVVGMSISIAASTIISPDND